MIVQPLAGFWSTRIAYDVHHDAKGSQFIGHNDIWSTVAFLGALKEFQSCLKIAALADQGFKNFTFVIYGPPKIMDFSIDPH